MGRPRKPKRPFKKGDKVILLHDVRSSPKMSHVERLKGGTVFEVVEVSTLDKWQIAIWTDIKPFVRVNIRVDASEQTRMGNKGWLYYFDLPVDEENLILYNDISKELYAIQDR